MGRIRGASSSIWSSRVPDISVESYSSGILALMKRVKGQASRMGTSISCTSSPFSTALTVNILSSLQRQLLGKRWALVLILRRWNSRFWVSPKQSMSSARRVSCLKEEAKMGYLQKLTLFLSSLRHSEVLMRVNPFWTCFYLLFSFMQMYQGYQIMIFLAIHNIQ